MSTFPHKRRFHAQITIGADSLDDLTQVLKEIIFKINAYDTRHCVSGGSSAGYQLDITEQPEMTGDRYRELLTAWHKGDSEAGQKQTASESIAEPPINMNITEVAAAAKVSEITVRRAIQGGELIARKEHGRVVVDAQAFGEWLQCRAVLGHAPISGTWMTTQPAIGVSVSGALSGSPVIFSYTSEQRGAISNPASQP